MNKILFATVLAAAGLPLFADVERTVEKSFPAQPGQTLKIETFSGSIEVQTSKEPVVKIELKEKINADSDKEADEILSRMTLKMEAGPEGVTAVSKHSGHFGSGFFGQWRNPIQLKWRVVVPEAYDLNLNTSGGSISVADIKGRVQADTSGGSIDLGDIDGPVKADTSGGQIRLKSATGVADLDTSGGSIHVGTAKAVLRADTSGGSISVKHADDVVKADTSGGSIDVAFFGPIKGNCELDTSGGSITVGVDAGAAFDLVADTSSGRVSCDLPLSKVHSKERDHLSGQVNGGGPQMKLDTSGGSIRILTN